MPRTVTALYRYPVKGLKAQQLRFVELKTGCAFPHDRRFAIAHRHSKFGSEQPVWVARRNFAVMAYSPEIATITPYYDETTRVLTLQCKGQDFRIGIDNEDADDLINQAFQLLDLKVQPGPYRLAEVEGIALTDSPEPFISIMNTRSLQDLQQTSGFDIDTARFRGNVWFEGEHPWEERTWVGNVMRLGEATVRVAGEIVRCSAIDMHPQAGRRDVPLLNKLGGMYGHTNFGVLAEVLQAGRLTTGDMIEQHLPHFGPMGI